MPPAPPVITISRFSNAILVPPLKTGTVEAAADAVKAAP
jgi:hypothetical protein